ncbi:hypothetical protein KS4_23400 [Poriferisphaera corsica]|uniref:Portal protein n=1 Tax=Poriferisphaera corsica TaxID=2528020 RepID=A0A517YVN7_9BACT|nr:hypothetical protein [Poriferisphaera corsica]QDU34273.1 hypothetical protein KS4_23400 [Poriferisphaera corsica]
MFGFNPKKEKENELRRKRHKTAMMVKDLVSESRSKLGDQITPQSTIGDQFTANMRAFLGDMWTTKAREGIHRMTLNMTGNAIMAMSAIQSDQSYRPSVEPVEIKSGDSPVYLSPKAARIITKHIERNELILDESITDDQLNSSAPLSQNQLEAIEPLTEPWVSGSNMAMPASLEPEDLIEVSDVFLAKQIQQRFNIMWDRAIGDFHLAEHDLYKNIFGHCPIGIEYDEESNSVKLFNANVLDVHIDPTCTKIEDAAYVIFDQYVPIETAIKQYPKYKDQIKKAADNGKFTRSSRSSDEHGTASAMGYSSVDFKRDMVTIRRAWLRDHQYPLPEDEVGGSQFNIIERSAKKIGTTLIETDGYELVTERNDSGEIVETSEIEYGDKDWPVLNGIRQLEIIAEIDEVVSDSPCPYSDIPWGWSVSWPIPYCPYGMGEPLRTQDLSEYINRLGTIIITIAHYSQYPETIMPDELLDHLQKMAGDKGVMSRPGRINGIPSNVWDRFVGQNGTTPILKLERDQLPADLLNFFFKLVELHSELSGNVDVLQGQAPTNNASAKLTENLGTVARGPIKYKAFQTEFTIRRLGRLIIDAMVKFMPPHIWDQMGDEYPPVVMDAIRRGAKSLKYDISVELQAGKGASKIARAEKARFDFGAGLIDRVTALEETGRNAEKIERRFKEQQEASAAETQQMALPFNQSPAQGVPAQA